MFGGHACRYRFEKRDRALIALTLLTGARDNAHASLRLKHVDLPEGKIVQDARDVRTKASKTITTYFFPVGDDFRTVVEEWVIFLQRERQWGLDDPLFPATRIIVGDSNRFEAAGLDRKCWRNAAPIRKVFRNAFAELDFPTSTRTHSEKHWRGSESRLALRLKSSRRGARI